MHNVAVSCEKTSSILNGRLLSRSTIKGVEVRETVTEEILMKSVLKTLREHKKLHMSKEELADTLKNSNLESSSNFETILLSRN
ncbi:hypothetical protein [Methanosarcina barkeri]|uniref:hypothetical protein n=1 Tax=Methanosarcina barkeri TaxID=2208 RepID=UPI0012D44229|nr:hypothetical protein [Methanosarcina barkeri]